MTQSFKTADSPSARMIRRFAAHRSVWIGGVLVGIFVVAATAVVATPCCWRLLHGLLRE